MGEKHCRARRGRSKQPHARLISIASLAITSLHLGCGASPPAGRHRVWQVDVEGLQHIDPQALEVCLGTRETDRVQLNAGSPTSLDCGEPPFDGARLNWPLFAWWNTPAPVFDENVLIRDEQRISRFMQARGYYDATIGQTQVTPSSVRPGATEHESDLCASQSCDVRVRFFVNEGEPVRVQRIELRGEDDLTPELRTALRAVFTMRRGEIFDEASFDATHAAMARVLADRGHPHGRVQGEAKIDRARHEAYLAFEIAPGPRAVLGRICVTGYEPLAPNVLYYATLMHPGDDFSLESIEEAQHALYALGTVASATIDYETRGVDPNGTRVTQDPDNQNTVTLRGESSVETQAATLQTSNTVASVDAHEAGATDSTLRRGRFCTESPAARSDIEQLDVEIAIRPGRLERLDFGLGFQSGQAAGFGASSQQQNGGLILSQWDIHVLGQYENRNIQLADSMLRLRAELKPRIIFPQQFPGFFLNDTFSARPGASANIDLRWPGFLEPRTVGMLGVSVDYGIAPLLYFMRWDLNARLGFERPFVDGKLYAGAFIRWNMFLPDGQQAVRLLDQREGALVGYLQGVVSMDLRDNPTATRQGVYALLDVQGSPLGSVLNVNNINSWNYVMFNAEVRFYVPLPYGVVFATRFGMGGMFTEPFGFNPNNVYDLGQLGPVSQQLIGGGPNDNRGFPAGYEGDVEQRPIHSRPEPDPNWRNTNAPVIISGGTRRWIASLELRIPFSEDFGFVLFGDAGDNSRASARHGDEWRFNLPQVSIGLGLRYRTAVGPIRFDMGFRPDDLQVVGGNDTRAPLCGTIADYERCRPRAYMFESWNWFGWGAWSMPAAMHVSIGDSF